MPTPAMLRPPAQGLNQFGRVNTWGSMPTPALQHPQTQVGSPGSSSSEIKTTEKASLGEMHLKGQVSQLEKQLATAQQELELSCWLLNKQQKLVWPS